MKKHVIRKHLLMLHDRATTLDMAVNAYVIFVGVQGSTTVSLWEIHDLEEERTEARTFKIVATGEPIEVDPIQYVGSVMLDEGRFVYHVFETTDRQRESKTSETPTRPAYEAKDWYRQRRSPVEPLSQSVRRLG
jgi:hypothetical protein